MFVIPTPMHAMLSPSHVILSVAKNLIVSLRTGSAKNLLVSLRIKSFPPHPSPLPPGEREYHSFPQQSGGAFRHFFINFTKNLIESVSENKVILRLTPQNDIVKQFLQPEDMRSLTYRNYAIMLAALGIFFLPMGSSHGESLYSTMEKGSHLYEQESYDEALKTFVDAQIESPEDPQVKYNIASSHYQMKNYEEAVKNYQDVAATARDIKLEEQSLYNIGNCLYRQGKLEESLEYYKKALDLDPEDQDAKYNLEFVREEIKKRLNQAKQREQEQQQENKQEGEGNQQQEQQKEGDTKEAERQQQEQPTQQQQAEEGKQDQAPQQKEEEQQEQAAAEEKQAASPREDREQDAQEKEGQARQMTREEAENWLRSVKEGKRDYSKQQEDRAGRTYRPSKDW